MLRPGSEIEKGMLKIRNSSASYTLLVTAGCLWGPGGARERFCCRSSELGFLPALLPLAFFISIFHHTAIYIRLTF